MSLDFMRKYIHVAKAIKVYNFIFFINYESSHTTYVVTVNAYV